MKLIIKEKYIPVKITKEHFDFLVQLNQSNNRIWFEANREWYEKIRAEVKLFFTAIYEKIQDTDSIEQFHIHRIYRDLRFSKDKTPFKPHFRLHLGRTKPMLRGGYYINIQPGANYISGGFWDPNSADIARIRQEIDHDSNILRHIFNDTSFKEHFGGIQGEELKTAPKGYDMNHSDIDLLRKKQFIARRYFTDQQVIQDDFFDEVIETFHSLRPFFDYMSEILTTDENGLSLFS